ncbi:TPA: phosphoheptose isomerase, partial [Pasteurella multocida]|nr:phosphoheptose isomerase [Pasteurella multocida]
MYLEQIKAELNEAATVLNKFINDENNMKLIQQAALLISDSFKQ